MYNITVIYFLIRVSATLQGGYWKVMTSFSCSFMIYHCVYQSGKKDASSFVNLFVVQKNNKKTIRWDGRFGMGRKRGKFGVLFVCFPLPHCSFGAYLGFLSFFLFSLFLRHRYIELVMSSKKEWEEISFVSVIVSFLDFPHILLSSAKS